MYYDGWIKRAIEYESMSAMWQSTPGTKKIHNELNYLLYPATRGRVVMTLAILEITARELQKRNPRVPVVEVINVDFCVADTHEDLFLD